MKAIRNFRLLFLLLVSLLGIVPSLPTFADGQSGTTLTATVNVNPHHTRTYHWTIDKSVQPASWDLFQGDSGTSRYTVALTRDDGTLATWVDGQVCITNGGAVSTQNLSVVAKLTSPPFNTVLASVIVDLSSNPILDPGETGCYDYHIDIPSPVVGATYKVTADVTITNHSGHLGVPFGPSPSSTAVLPDVTPINASVEVEDNNGQAWIFNGSGSVEYSRTFDCDDEGTNDNLAMIMETGQYDTASVEVHCYSLSVSKTAETSYDRTYQWSISKTGSTGSVTLATGESVQVSYNVTVTNTGHTDDNFAVNGSITVSNPAPIDATINTVADIMSDGTTPDVDCGVSFAYILSTGGSLNCTYSSPLPDASDHTNTAVATLQNHAYGSDGSATPSGTTDTTRTIAVSFDNATVTKLDDCVSVSDTIAGALGVVCVNQSPKTFSYNATVGPYATCGSYAYNNTASFTTNTGGGTGSASWTINVNVPCAGGCTLTLGYWKTHSHKGPAPYDDAWKLLPGGQEENTVFFLSGKTWYQVFWTPPAGNAYYNLAHQYMAAKLNILNGAATTPAVAAAITWSETQFFNLYMPGNFPAGVKKSVLSNATLLDNYNNGLIGPGHCSE
ncbi:MAG TPA: hypothetical protein VHL11_06190 [Phototrophicaceae bacterium]|nr:hypothetical protein [Phototrophicaceae bacterium]